MKNRLCSILTLGSSLGLILSVVSPVQAVEKTFNFTVDVNDGPLLGSQFTGSTTFDTDDIIADEFDPSSSFIEQPTISFNFLNQVFTEADDIEFPLGEFPQAFFADGNFIGLDYIVNENSENPLVLNPVEILGDTTSFGIFDTEFVYASSGDLFEGGVVTYEAVPEPSILAALLALGAGGMGLIRHKRQGTSC